MPIVLTRATKLEARYKALGGAEHCSACRFYMPQGTCGRIIGPVSPEGWCKYHSREFVQRWQPGSAGGNAAALPPGATLDLSFMSPGTLDPRITFTRASTATYTDSTGTIQTAAVNAPRWDYDPATHALRGLLIEEARTNVLLNSATLGTQSVAVTAQAYTLSFYGTGTITYSGAASGSLVGTGPQRASATFTPAGGTLTCTVTGSVSNAQLEAGSFSTTIIPTTAAAVTRAQDICYIPTNVSWYSGAAFSLFMEFDGPPAGWPGGAIGGLSDGTFANSFYPNVDGAPNGNVNFIPTSTSSPLQAVSRTAINKLVGVFSLTRLASDINGGVVGGTAQSASPFTAPTRLVIGNAPWDMSTSFNGHIRRVSYWPRALSDAEMQQVTT